MNTKKVLKVLGVAAVAGLTLGGLTACTPEPVPCPACDVCEVCEVVDKEAIFQEGVASVEIPVCPLNQSAEVEELNKNLAEANSQFLFVCESLEDREVIEDANECLVEIKAEDAAIELAIDEIKDEGLDFLEDEGILEDEDDLEFVKVYGDYDDIEILESDYDDEEYKFKIEAKIKDDNLDEKVKVVFTVEVEDGEAVLDAVELVE